MRLSPCLIRFLIEAGAVTGAGFFCTKKAGTHKPGLILNSCKPLQYFSKFNTNSIKNKKGDKTRLEATNFKQDGKP